MEKYVSYLFAWGLLCLSLTSQAEGIAALKDFLRNTQTIQCHFQQSLVSTDNRQQQRANGVFYLQRPGKFHWHYQQPYQQFIISDGHSLWLYDVDLAQVTIKNFAQGLSNTPALWLAGNSNIEQDYQLSEQAEQDGVAWVLATPKHADTQFTAVRLAFRGKQLIRMDLRDHFDQQTIIEFSNIHYPHTLNPQYFKFTPPAGVDIIDERH